MISSVVALLTEIVPNPAVPNLVPVTSIDADGVTPATFGLDQEVNMLRQTVPTEVAEDPDRRQLFLGHWDCVGKKTGGGQEQPYHGHMHNVWTLDKAWLLIQFKEYQPASGHPFAEDQYWGFNAATGKHTRPMMTTSGGFGILYSSGWQGDTIEWSGTYTDSGTTFMLTEKMTILEHNKVYWFGDILMDGTSVGSYELICTRKNQGNSLATPTV